MNTTTVRPTAQALRLHRSHLATTHRAPLVPRTQGARARATSFTPMPRAPRAPRVDDATDQQAAPAVLDTPET